MNDNPATEYAVYFPDMDGFLCWSDGTCVIFHSIESAVKAAVGNHGAEVRSRLNYTVTPWFKEDVYIPAEEILR